MISVIIPAYNREKLIRRAVCSVLDQTWTDLEVIVVDDGSTDQTRQVVASIEDARVRYYAMDQNSGACAARNSGIRLARGEYIAFQDSDDAWMPNKLEIQMQQLRESGADIVFCSFERYGMDGKLLHVFPMDGEMPGRISYQRLLGGNLISTQTMLGRRECFEAVPFDPAFPRLQDWELMLRMVQRYDVRYFDIPLVRLYEQTDSISNQPQKMVTALNKLWEIHHGALEADRALKVGFRCMQYVAAQKCGQSVWYRYLGELSPGNPVYTNLRLLRSAGRSLIRQLVDSLKG